MNDILIENVPAFVSIQATETPINITENNLDLSIVAENNEITILENSNQITVGGKGYQGASGRGVPIGGTTGQVLTKIDDDNYNTEWVTPEVSGGTVTTVSIASANGFSGTVANPTTTPAITLRTSVTGILYGNGTSIATAIADNFPTLNQDTTGNAATATLADNVSGVILPIKGGTGISNNAASTITINGNFGITLTVTGTTSVTLPTSGTLTTLSTVLSTANSFTKAQIVSQTPLTSATAHIAIDASLSNNYYHVMTENTTLDAPSNLTTGSQFTIIFKQHASAAKTLSLNAAYIPLGTAFTITTTVGSYAALNCYSPNGSTILYTWAQA